MDLSLVKMELFCDPKYKELTRLLVNLEKLNDNGFMKWHSVFCFIIFAFENLTNVEWDIKDELMSTYSVLNEIYNNWNGYEISEYEEAESYDAEINKFLGRLRMRNLQTTLNIKGAD